MVLDDALAAIIWLREQFNPATCDADYLDRHARSRGLARWQYEPDRFWRKRVEGAYSFHHLGGRTYGLQQILGMAGISAEIIEPADITTAMEPDTPRLDGRRLGFLMTTPTGLQGLPPLRWAEFLVNMNWGSTGTGQYQLARKIVAEYKAARSLDKFRIYLGFDTPRPGALGSGATAKAQSTLAYPHRLRLDGSWRLGRDATPCRLDGRPLDGAWGVGEILPVAVTERFSDPRLRTGASGAKTLTIPPGRRAAFQPKPLFRLDRTMTRLDGSWNVGTAEKRLDGSWRLDGETKFLPPQRLGEQPVNRLAVPLRLGWTEPVCTGWPAVS